MADEKDKRAKAEQTPAEEEIVEGEILDEGDGAGEPAMDVTLSQEYNALAEELQQAQGKAKEFFDGWQRERADFANYKRRVERDQQLVTQNIKGDIVKRYLTVLDDLERA